MPAAPVSCTTEYTPDSIRRLDCCVSVAPLQQDEALSSLADNVVVTTVSFAFILLVRYRVLWHLRRHGASWLSVVRWRGWMRPEDCVACWPQVILLQYAYLGSRLQAFIREHEGMMHVVKRIFDDIKRAKQPGT